MNEQEIKDALEKIKTGKVKCHCPHCDQPRCPVCGRRLWPTPHGPQPCHPPYPDYLTYPPRWYGTYTDEMGLHVAID